MDSPISKRRLAAAAAGTTEKENDLWLDLSTTANEIRQSYENRIEQLNKDHQQDIEEILQCYKSERAQFEAQRQDQEDKIQMLEIQIKEAQQKITDAILNHEKISADYKLSLNKTKDIFKQVFAKQTLNTIPAVTIKKEPDIKKSEQKASKAEEPSSLYPDIPEEDSFSY